jgi:hypothetical protein
MERGAYGEERVDSGDRGEAAYERERKGFEGWGCEREGTMEEE